MEVQTKLESLSTAAQYDVCGFCGSPRTKDSPLGFIHEAAVPGKAPVSLLKVLLTNYCVNDCMYCVNQVGRDIPRSAFQPEELAKLFMELHEKKLVQGLFLSSGIASNPSRTMGAMLGTAEILRKHYEFAGYIHLKIMPGAPFGSVEEGCKLASRVSVNIEAPTAKHLSRLTSGKEMYQDILTRMRWVKELKSERDSLIPSGQTTQFVVGAAGEKDLDILKTTQKLYREMELRRVYYSAFTPVSPHSGNIARAPPVREHRLYQTDWLMRVYRYPDNEVELALDNEGNLPLDSNPKLVIAEKQPWLFPIDLNGAEYNELIRVPGIGPVSAKKILSLRKDTRIDSMNQLRKMRVLTGVAAPFIWFKGIEREERQLPLPGGGAT